MKKLHKNIWRAQTFGNLVTTLILPYIFSVTVLKHNSVTNFYRHKIDKLPSYLDCSILTYDFIKNFEKVEGRKEDKIKWRKEWKKLKN